MKKLIRIRILAMLCLFFRRHWRDKSYNRRMIKLRTENRHFNHTMTRFFQHNPPELVRYFTLIIFQCWAINDCKLKTEVADQEFAEFLDQLNDFVASAYRFHKSRTGGLDAGSTDINYSTLRAN